MRVDAAQRRTEGEDGVPEPSSTYQAVAICEIEEMYSLVGGLFARSLPGDFSSEMYF